jgi:predicted MFS family arabinose efflux permease
MRDLLLSKTFASLFLQSFLAFCGLNVLSVVPDHLVAIGASKTYVGIYMNVGSLALVLLVLPMSSFTDRIGRKRLLLATYALAIAGNLLSFALADDLAALMALRVTNALIFCTTFTIHPAEAFGMVPRDRRLTGMAIFGISGLLSSSMATWVGERVLMGLGAPWLFIASALFLLPGMALAAGFKFHKPASLAGRAGFLSLAGRKELRGLLIMAFMIGSAFTVFSSFLANLSRERLGLVHISVFWTAFAAIAFVVRLLFVRHLERLPGNAVAAGCFALVVLSLVLGWQLGSVWQLVPAGLLYGLGSGILFPLVSTAFVNTGDDDDRLGLNNLFSSVNTLGNVIMAVVLGAAADWLGVPAAFLIMGILLALTIPVALGSPVRIKAG